MMMIGGIVTICMRKKESVSAFIVPFVFYIVGALLGAANVGSYADLAIWSALAAVFGTLHLLFLFLCREVNIILSILVSVMIVVAIAGFTVMSSRGSEDGGSTDTASGNQGATMREIPVCTYTTLHKHRGAESLPGDSILFTGIPERGGL